MLTLSAESRPVTPERIKLVEPQVPENVPPAEFWRRVRWYVMLGISWCLRNPGWFGSAIFHVAVVASLADVLLREQHEQRPVGIEAVLENESQELGFDMALDQSVMIESVPMSSPDEAMPVSNDVLPADPSARTAAQLAGTAKLTLPGQGTGTDGEAVPELSGGGFFGTAAAGKSFVYVVDMSQSMEGDRFRRAKAELKRSINKLKPAQKFYVIFFNDQAFPLFYPRPAKGLVDATGTMRSKAVRWINNQQPISVTNPEPALQMAIEMQPDVIFFLTDGEIPIEVRENTLKANKGHIVIHTIAFASDDGKLLLEQMAKDNGGTYRFVR